MAKHGQTQKQSRHDDISLYLDQRTWRKHDYSSRPSYHLKLRFVRNDGRTSDGHYDIRNPDTNDPRQQPYDDLCIEGYVRIEENGEQTLYGVEVLYDNPFTVDLRQARYMVKTLTKIAKAIESSSIQPKSYGQYAALVAKALHCGGIFVRVDMTTTSDYRSMKHHTYTVSQIQNVIDHEVDTYVKAMLPEGSHA